MWWHPRCVAKVSARSFAQLSCFNKSRSVTFDKNMPVQKRVKAWEKDGEDKDTWFRRKYAHVHAKQLKYRDPQKPKVSTMSQTTTVKRRIMPKLQRNPLLEYVFGTNSVIAALQSNKRDFYTRLLYHGDIPAAVEKLAKQKNVELHTSDKHQLNLLTNYGVHNNLVLETKPLQPSEVFSLGQCNLERHTFDYITDAASQSMSTFRYSTKRKYPLGVYLDEVVDPHNIGAIIRSAFFLGVDFIAMTRKNCGPLSPVVAKTSSGSLEYMDIFYVEKPLNFFQQSQQNGDWTFITSCLTTKDKRYKNMDGKFLELADLSHVSNEMPVMIVVGNEGQGVRTNLKMRSDFFVEIPRFLRDDHSDAPVDSLNVSVATALLINSALK